MKTLETKIEINASAEKVWKLLTTFKDFPNWNPFIREASGEIAEGAQLRVVLQSPGSSAMTFQPNLLMVQPERELRWLGRLLMPGIFDGEHIFKIEPLSENQIRFTQVENFRGLLVPFLWKSLDTNTRQGFENMNVAIKKLAETP